MLARTRTAPLSGLDLSAPGALAALFASHRARFGDATMKEGDGEGAGETPPAKGEAAPKEGEAGGEQTPPPEKGYPEGTPVAEMTDAQQAAYWREASRKHEARVKSRGDYDDLKARAEKYDAHVASSATDQDKAVTAALAQGRTEAMAEANTKVSVAMVRAGLSARGVTGDAADGLLEAVNPAAFIVGDDVDTNKVAAWVARVAGPVKAVDLGQGTRTTTRASGVAAGMAAYQESRPKKAS